MFCWGPVPSRKAATERCFVFFPLWLVPPLALVGPWGPGGAPVCKMVRTPSFWFTQTNRICELLDTTAGTGPSFLPFCYNSLHLGGLVPFPPSTGRAVRAPPLSGAPRLFLEARGPISRPFPPLKDQARLFSGQRLIRFANAPVRGFLVARTICCFSLTSSFPIVRSLPSPTRGLLPIHTKGGSLRAPLRSAAPPFYISQCHCL